MAQMKNSTMVFMALIFVVGIIGVLWFVAPRMQPNAVDTGNGVDNGLNPLPNGETCVLTDDGTTTISLRFKDALTTGSSAYLGTSVYLMDLTEPSNDPLAVTTLDNATYGTNANGVTGHEYELVTYPGQDGEGSFSIKIGRLCGATFTKTYELDDFAVTNIKIKNVDLDTWLESAATNASNTYEATTGSLVFDNAGSATTLGADASITYDIWARAGAAGDEFGDLGTYMAIDASPSVWEGPGVMGLSRNGVALSEVKASLNDVDKVALSDYEYVYDLGEPIGYGAGDKFTFYTTTKSGVNPGASDEVGFRFLSKTRYLSDKALEVKEGIFQDDSSTTEAATATAQGPFKVDIA